MTINDNPLDKISCKILVAIAKKALQGDSKAAKTFFELRKQLQPKDDMPSLMVQEVPYSDELTELLRQDDK
jgi:hypothetical protein